MKKIAVLVLSALLAAGISANAQMADSQVVEYAKSAVSAGKSQSQIAKELLAKGVTQEQVERIRQQYENGELGDTTGGEITAAGTTVTRNSAATTTANDAALRQARPAEPVAKSDIFGHDIFTGRDLTFEPNENIATPSDYVLGPGDEVLIEIWGYNEATISQTISPEGRINISQIGPIYLSGLTVAEASAKIKKSLVSKYASIAGETPNTSVSVSLGQIRTIQVNIMGEVNTPGTYRLSSFATVFNALYNANGVTDNGSLRAIKVIRSGKQVGTVDIYGYLFEGKSDSDVRLKEGDIIIVPPYLDLVTINGNVKRPMKYEMKSGETLSTLIEYAGGFSSDAYRGDVNVVRVSGPEKAVATVASASFASYDMEDGDVVTVRASIDRYSNMVTVEGSVFRPGSFELGGNIATVRQLIEAAGGPTEDAFLGRAVLKRQKEDLSFETESVDLKKVLSGDADIMLRKNDALTVSSKYDIQERGTLTINGLVNKPGTFTYSDNTTVEDLILLAGGLADGASYARVDIARRISDPNSLEASDTIGETFSVSLKDGMAMDGEPFYLQPYDIVSVRKSPVSGTQDYVSVNGAVQFPGSYVMLTEGERISSVISRAGGANNKAFVAGATLVRQMNADEIQNMADLIDKASNISGKDTLGLDEHDLEKRNYRVAINLDKALSEPGSDYDIILRNGDVISIPEYSATVRVSGEVMNPSAISYIPGKSASYYIGLAGGYNNQAKRSKAYVLYMNGSAKRASSAKIEPGCQVIVPAKPEKKAMSTSELLSIGTSTASLAAMIVTIVNNIK